MSSLRNSVHVSVSSFVPVISVSGVVPAILDIVARVPRLIASTRVVLRVRLGVARRGSLAVVDDVRGVREAVV